MAEIQLKALLQKYKNENKVLQKISELKSYNDRIPLYNLIGSEVDYNKRIMVDEFIESLKGAK